MGQKYPSLSGGTGPYHLVGPPHDEPFADAESIAHELAHHIVTRANLDDETALSERLNGAQNPYWLDWQEIYALGVEITAMQNLGVVLSPVLLSRYACRNCFTLEFKRKPKNIEREVRKLLGAAGWMWHVRRFERYVNAVR